MRLATKAKQAPSHGLNNYRKPRRATANHRKGTASRLSKKRPTTTSISSLARAKTNTSNPNTANKHATAEELNAKLENAMTNRASTTQNEQPQDNTITNNEHDDSYKIGIQRQMKTDKHKRDASKMIKKQRRKKTQTRQHLETPDARKSS